MYFRMRIGLGKHVDERKNEVVRVPMIVELALIVIKRGIRALRISVQNPDHPLTGERGGGREGFTTVEMLHRDATPILMPRPHEEIYLGLFSSSS